MRTAALLLSGGSGLRLWPSSTQERPKQFLPLFKDRSLYAMTLERLVAADIDTIYVSGNAMHRDLLKEQAVAAGAADVRFIFEPVRRDSAAAIAAGVACIASDMGDDVVVLVLPCDHLIADGESFATSLTEAIDLARLGYLATFGIMPTFPSTEFGYIQRGARIPGHRSAFEVEKFHEKPRAEIAATYLACGDYDWNGGMFAFMASVFRREAEQHMAAIWCAALQSSEKATRSGSDVHLDAAAFRSAPKTSIDFGLMEKSQCVGVVPATFDWSDVGNWSAVYEASAKDVHESVLVGNVLAHAAKRSLIHADGIKVVVSGIDDLIVVGTPEGVFIARKGDAPMVKTLLEKA
jgi:mannose-1-phosphate guanylyltransferase/mannose-6-phosphate isomerase